MTLINSTLKSTYLNCGGCWKKAIFLRGGAVTFHRREGGDCSREDREPSRERTGTMWCRNYWFIRHIFILTVCMKRREPQEHHWITLNDGINSLLCTSILFYSWTLWSRKQDWKRGFFFCCCLKPWNLRTVLTRIKVCVCFRGFCI